MTWKISHSGWQFRTMTYSLPVPYDSPKDSLTTCKSDVRFGFSTLKFFSNLLIPFPVIRGETLAKFHQACDEPHHCSFGMGCSTAENHISHLAILRWATTSEYLSIKMCGSNQLSALAGGCFCRPLATDNGRLVIWNGADPQPSTRMGYYMNFMRLRMRIGPTIISCCRYKEEQPPKINAVLRCFEQQSLVH